MADTDSSHQVDAVDRAHLTGQSHPSPPIARYDPSPDLLGLVTRFWVPVWSTPHPLVQRTLQHPNPLLVITDTYARFYGVTRGLSTVTLEGDGWAFGTMLRPAAGVPLLGAPMSTLTDTHLDLADLPGLPGSALRDAVRAVMAPEPSDPARHAAAQVFVEDALRHLLPLDRSGHLANAVVDWVTTHPDATRVADLAAGVGLSERSLQRLVDRHLGLTPKWLLQRRRIQDAVLLLKEGSRSLADVAAEVGYADQAHFTHDFRDVTGMTPGEYASDQG